MSNINVTEENVLNLKLKALILDTIHHIDVIEKLIYHNTVSLNDWHWKKELRYVKKKTKYFFKFTNFHSY